MIAFTSSRALLAAGAAVLALGLASCKRPQDPFRPAKVGDASRAMWSRVGEELAAAAAPLVKEGGRVLLVRAGKDTSVSPDQDVIEQAFRTSLAGAARAAEVIVAAVPNAARPSWAQEDYPVLPGPVTAAWLGEAIGKDGSIKVVASLVGEPAGRAASRAVPVVCFAPAGGDSLAAMIRSGAVVAAIASRRDPPAADGKDWFEMRYAVLTSTNIASWVQAKP
jgi:hypothetical protein